MAMKDWGIVQKNGSSHRGKLPEVDHSCFRWTADLICGAYGSTQEGWVELRGSTLKARVVGKCDQCRLLGQRRRNLLSRSRDHCP